MGDKPMNLKETLAYINERRPAPITLGTLRSYVTRAGTDDPRSADMPPPDDTVKRGAHTSVFYKPSTIDAWLARRPGPGNWGARKDDSSN